MKRLLFILLLLGTALVASGPVLAGQITVYDFLANASGASWSNPAQTVTFRGGTSTEGQAALENGYLEDGRSHLDYILTQPDSRADVSRHYIRGAYTISIPEDVTDVTFTATVGLKRGSDLSTGMSLSLLLHRYGQWTALCETTQYYDGVFSSMSANLSGYQGETLELYLDADANGDPAGDLGVWLDARIIAVQPETINVRDYGAIPNDGIDDYQAVTNAIEAAKGLGTAARVGFEDGEYRLSGRLTISDAKHGLILEGGTDTRFTMTNRNAGAILASRSGNVVIKNFTIEWDPLPYTQGTITSVAPGYFILDIDPGYPDDDWLCNNATYGVIHDPNIPGRIKHGSLTHYNVTCQRIGTRKFQVSASERPIEVGDRFSVVRRIGDWALCAGDSPEAHALFKNINMYSGPSMSCVAGNLQKLFVRNCNFCIKPGTDRIQGPNGDGVHVQSNKYGPEIVNCLFEGQLDDAVNLYAVQYIVREIASSTRFLVDTLGKSLKMGDEMIVFRPSTGAAVGRARVINMAGGPTGVDITLDSPIPGVRMDDLFYDRTWTCGGYLIAHNTFRNFRGTGVYAKAHDGMIWNNQFIGLAYLAVNLSNDVTYYTEGLQVENVSVLNNFIDDCVIAGNQVADPAEGGVIRIKAMASSAQPAADRIHHNITIAGNTVNDWPRHAVVAASSSNISIHDNDFVNTMDTPKASSGNRGIMYFDNCGGVSVTDNRIRDDRPQSLINGKLFVSRMGQMDILASENTYTVNTSAPEITAIGGWDVGRARSSWDLAGDWSDTSNPNGQWSCGSGSGGAFTLISTHQDAWFPTLLGSNQPAWAAGPSSVPGWCKSTGRSSYDFAAGKVGCYGPAVLRWTSPRSGMVQISGGVWLLRDFGRDQTWELRSNGVTFSSGTLRWGPTSGSPMLFSSGSGVAGALNRHVDAGQNIELYIHKSGTYDDFVGTDLSISYADSFASGVITDMVSGVPVQDATVYLAGTSNYTHTGADGSYTFANVPLGLYTMSAYKPGFYPQTMSIDIPSDVPVQRNLQIQSVPPAPFTWNAAASFSDSINPNGPWKFEGFAINSSTVSFGPMFDAFSPDWEPGEWDNAPGWFQSEHDFRPGVAKSNGTFYLNNVPSGYLVSTAPASITWTAPRDTIVTANCSVWNPRSFAKFGLCLNDQIISQAIISGKTWSTPFVYSKSFTLNMGDRIALLNGPSGDYIGIDFSIVESPNGMITGTVKDIDGLGVTGALVSTSTGGFSTTTNSSGAYTLSNVSPGIYAITASKAGYYRHSRSVEVSAAKKTTADFLISPTVAPSLSTPVAMTNAAIGGQGVTGGVGLNNLGLLVKTTGRVTYKGDGYFYIDDGSGLADGSGRPGVKVQATDLVCPDQEVYVAVTGFISYYTSGTARVRVIVARDQNDIAPLQ